MPCQKNIPFLFEVCFISVHILSTLILCQKNLPGQYKLNEVGDLITTPDLNSLGLAINTELNVFICMHCASALTTTNVGGHFQRLHPEIRLLSTLDQLAADCGITDTYPIFAYPEEPRLQFSGIKVQQDASGCPLCAYTAVNPKTIQSHLTKKHPGSKASILTELQAQRLNKGASKASKKYIRVKPRLPPITSTTFTLLDEFQDFKWQKYQVQDTPNARLVSPWLMRTNWHDHIHPHLAHIPELCELVEIPDATEFPGLKHAVLMYFQTATGLLANTDELVRQIINSADPDKE